MSKRTRTKPAPTTAPAPPAPDAEPSLGAEVLRRMLLAVVAALIVARPFVRGEDAGLLSDFSDPGAMVLTFLTLAGCAGWAAWRLWSPPGGVYVGAVEVGLFALAALYFIGAAIAPYPRAAYLVAAEWLGLALLLLLVRQLAVRPADQQGLIAALLATAVALSAQGVVQVQSELPRVAAEGKTVEQSVAVYSNVRLARPTPLEEQQLRDQLEHRKASGPFFHPSSLAGCLVLLLPVMVGSLVAAVRGRASVRSLLVVGGAILACLVLTGVVLGMTRDVVAVAVLAVVGLPALGAFWPARSGGGRVGVGLGLLTAAGVVGLLFSTGRMAADLVVWREAWPATWKLIDEHFWRGVGPAQFRFAYPRFMPESAGYKLADPSSSLLEVMAEVGVGGALLLALLLGALGVAVWRWWRGAVSDQRPAGETPVRTASEEAAQAGDMRWEFYLGGMVAAIVSFTLRASALPPEEIGPEAIAAGVRSVVWFFAFALSERISWTPREYVGSLLVGVAGLALFFLFRPGLAYPGVAALLWIAVALVLGVVRPAPVAWPGSSPVLRWIVEAAFAPRRFAGLWLAVLLGASFVYFALVLYPASTAAGRVQEARLKGAELLFDREKKKPEERTITKPLEYIDEEVLKPLVLANREDADNPRTLKLLASWTLQRWALAPLDDSNRGGPIRGSPTGERNPGMDEKASAWAALARKANPEDADGYRAEYEVLERRCLVLTELAHRLDEEGKKNKKLNALERAENARTAAGLRAKIQKGYRAAAETMEAAIPRDPTNPYLYFLLASARFKSGDRVGANEAAREALRLDRAVPRPRSLPDRERAQMGPWLLGQSPR